MKPACWRFRRIKASLSMVVFRLCGNGCRDGVGRHFVHRFFLRRRLHKQFKLFAELFDRRNRRLGDQRFG